MANGAQPMLVIQQNLPGYVQELEDEALKIVGRLQEIHAELAKARMVLAVAYEKPQDPASHEQRAAGKARRESNEPTSPNS